MEEAQGYAVDSMLRSHVLSNPGPVKYPILQGLMRLNKQGRPPKIVLLSGYQKMYSAQVPPIQELARLVNQETSSLQQRINLRLRLLAFPSKR